MIFYQDCEESRFNALVFLISNYDKFPTKVNTVNEISGRKYKGFRFIQCSDGIYFSDCVSKGISELDFYQYREKLTGIENKLLIIK